MLRQLTALEERAIIRGGKRQVLMFLRLLTFQLLIPTCLVAGPIHLCVHYVPDNVQCSPAWDSEDGVNVWHRPTPAAFLRGRTEIPHVKLACAAPPEFRASELRMDARAEIRPHSEEHHYFPAREFKLSTYPCLRNGRVEHSGPF
jgi:hypothetical protein